MFYSIQPEHRAFRPQMLSSPSGGWKMVSPCLPPSKPHSGPPALPAQAVNLISGAQTTLKREKKGERREKGPPATRSSPQNQIDPVSRWRQRARLKSPNCGVVPSITRLHPLPPLCLNLPDTLLLSHALLKLATRLIPPGSTAATTSSRLSL